MNKTHKKTLLVVESPSKARTISKYVGPNYVVKASVGHVRDLPKSNKNAIDIEGGFVPYYEISKGKEKVVAEIAGLIKKADRVVLATDLDREGEAIAWHILEAVKQTEGIDLSKKSIERIIFNEITKEAVQTALAHPRSIDEGLKRAQEARRVLDRLFGYGLSGLIWKKVRYGLSAGRVQSPALRIVMEREREIRAFKPEKYWVVTADVSKKSNKDQIFNLTCSKEFKEEETVKEVLSIAKRSSWKVSEVKEKEIRRFSRPPFKTSTLQQAASSRYGFTPARTMGIAQKLYEKGLITYMRTDSLNISSLAQKNVISLVEKKYGKKFAQATVFSSKSKTAQEAHEAIRPTDVRREDLGATGEEKKLYQLIWQRTVSSQMAPARLLKTKVVVAIEDKAVPNFYINGSRLLFPGWFLADPGAQKEDVNLPKMEEGEELLLKKIESQAKETQPPSRYSEAGLVKELEKREIGRPSTYATILKNIVDRGYVEKKNSVLYPTDTGDVVSSFLEKNFESYISDSFTSRMEGALDEIAEGKKEYVATLDNFYKPFSRDVKAKESIEKLTNLGEAPKKFSCPICKGKMIVKLGKGGKFLSCSRFPDCDGALTMEGREIKPEEPIGVHPENGEEIFVLSGRFGPYVQMGRGEERKKKTGSKKPRRASIPKNLNPDKITVEEAATLLSLPRDLGNHPQTGKKITVSIGRFGPYVVHDDDFRSLKKDDPYNISRERALEILSEEKSLPRGVKKVKDIGLHPKTKKMITLYESSRGYFLKKGRKRIFLPSDTNVSDLTIDKVLNKISS